MKAPGGGQSELLKEYEIEIPKELKDQDQVSVNIWVCNGQVLRLVMNPFTPSILPYYAVPFEVNPYSFFGVGIAENMDDTQNLMNGFMRMSVDNAALSGNLLIEVDETRPRARPLCVSRQSVSETGRGTWSSYLWNQVPQRK